MIFPRVKNYLRKKICSRGTVAAILLLIMALMLPAALTAQSFVYVNNQDTTNTVSGFNVLSTGVLQPIVGSPFVTGGAGSTVTCFGLDRMVVTPASSTNANKFIFVSNSGDQTISAFQINTTTGALTLAPGTPAATGLAIDGCGGISLAVTPDGNFLMASSGGAIQSFNIGATGALTPAVLTPAAQPETSVGMKISPNGQFLALSTVTGVSMYTNNNNGSLTAIGAGPFPGLGSGQIAGLEFSCAADTLYANEASGGTSSITDAWSVATTGTLTPIAGSPFLATGQNADVVVLSADNTKLYTSDQLNNAITAFDVVTGGGLINPLAFGGVGTVHAPTGLAIDANGTFLYVADDSVGIAVFGIAANGSLTALSDVTTLAGQTMQSVAAYPTRSCVSADVSLSMNPAITVSAGTTATFTVSVTNPATATGPATVTVSDLLPAGLSFAPATAALPTLPCTFTAGTGSCSQGSTNPLTITFSAIPVGTTSSVDLSVIVSPDLLNNAALTNTATITNRSVIETAAAVNVATSTITVSAVSGPTTLSVPTATASYQGTAALTATLATTGTHGAVSGKTISFTFNGAAVGSAVTNAVGQASLNVSVAGLLVGSYPGAITASFAGDTDFGASSGTGNLTINPAVLTVSSSFSIVYGNPVPTPQPVTITGFVGTDTIAMIATLPTCTSGVLSPVPPVPPATVAISTPAGSYPTSCSVAGLTLANYTFVAVPGVATVAPAPITVVVNNVTRLYGQSNDGPPSVFTSTVTGAKNGELVTPIYVTTADTNSPVGIYQIVPLAPLNYIITSATSGTLTITQAPVTVVVNSVSRVFGTANPLFSGTITGMLPGDGITATYSTTATATSPAGVYPITVQFHDPNFKLGNYTVTITNGTLTIQPATLTIAADSFTRLYGSANPVLTGSVLGLVAGDGITATYTTTATATSPVGSYPITPVISDPLGRLGNYIVTIVNGTLTVNPATLTVNINNATRVYGNANPTFSGTITGLVNGDAITATYTSVGVTSPVGTFPITPIFKDLGAKLGNYTVAIIGGNLTITPAPLTVTAVGGTRLYGGVNPAATITGLKNGDNITATYITPTSASAPGAYTLSPVLVDPNGLAGNYTVTTRTAVLTINKAPLTVTATSSTVVLNTGTPGFTATYTGFVLGETSANLTGTLACTAGVNTIGAHPITCTGQTSANYALTFVAGTATVDYAPVGACTNGPGHQILAPINADGSSIFTRATTATIPAQFSVCDANGKSIGVGGVVTNFRLLQKITGGTTTTLNQNQGGFTFSGSTGVWTSTINTSNPTNLAAGSTYLYQITLNDGTTINFQFSLN